MAYADGLLSTGERIFHREKQHWWVFVWGARFTILAVVLAIVLGILSTGLATDGASGTIRTALTWIVAVLFIGGLALLFWTTLRYLNQEYVLTNRRVIQVEGVLNRNSTDSSLEKINDAVLTQSIFGRMFDYGDLTVLTASEAGIDKMHMLRKPIAFKKAMLDAKHEFEVDMERSGWQPSPPIRDPAPAPAAGSSAADTAAASPAPPAPRADPDEVTRTLASLADLRDRGAITPEEYELKKADLLSRL